MSEGKKTPFIEDIATKRIRRDINMFGCMIMATLSSGSASRWFAIMATISFIGRTIDEIKSLKE